MSQRLPAYRNRRFLLRSFLSIISGALIMLSLGSAYAISAWNAQLKDALNLNQTEIGWVASMSSLGLYLSPPPGLFYDNFGVRWSVFCSAVLLSILYLLVYLSIFYWSEITPGWVVALIFALIGQASDFAIFASIGANEGLFGSSHRGAIMGILFSAFSAGGAVFAFVFHAYYSHNVAGYFLFMSVELLAVCTIGVLFLCPSISGKHLKLDGYEDSPLISRQFHHPDQQEITGIELLQNTEFWVIFFPVMFCIGSALFVMTNISFLVKALGGSSELCASLVAIFSTSNMISRFLIGSISDRLQRYTSRSSFFQLSIGLTCISQVLFIFSNKTWLYLPMMLAGIAEGGLFATFPVLIRESFGVENYGKNFGLISVANAIGFPLILGPISTAMYNARSFPTKSGTNECVGNHCFQSMFILCTILCSITFFLSCRLAKCKSI